jgi:hypothetical protein
MHVTEGTRDMAKIFLVVFGGGVPAYHTSDEAIKFSGTVAQFRELGEAVVKDYEKNPDSEHTARQTALGKNKELVRHVFDVHATLGDLKDYFASLKVAEKGKYEPFSSEEYGMCFGKNVKKALHAIKEVFNDDDDEIEDGDDY